MISCFRFCSRYVCYRDRSISDGCQCQEDHRKCKGPSRLWPGRIVLRGPCQSSRFWCAEARRWRLIPGREFRLLSLEYGYKNSHDRILLRPWLVHDYGGTYSVAKILLALATTLLSKLAFSARTLWSRASSKLMRIRPPFLARMGRARS